MTGWRGGSGPQTPGELQQHSDLRCGVVCLSGQRHHSALSQLVCAEGIDDGAGLQVDSVGLSRRKQETVFETTRLQARSGPML